MAIYNIRHCETYGNKHNKFGGDSEVQLTIKGIDQAKSLGYRLLDEKQDFTKYRFISSPKMRTQHTLQIIMEILGVEYTNIIEIEPLIKTKYKGYLENMTKEEAKIKYKKELEEREKDPWNWCYPGGGESFASEYERIMKFLDKYKDVKDMVFVGHQGVCSVIAEILSGKTKEEIMNNRMNLKFNQNHCFVKYDDGSYKYL